MSKVVARFSGMLIVLAVLSAAVPHVSANKVIRNVRSDALVGAKAQEPPTGFRNFKWGSRSQGNIATTTATSEGVKMYLAENPLPLFGVPVTREAYLFLGDRFYEGDAYLNGEVNFRQIKRALINSFGPPSFADENLGSWNWEWPGTGIEVHLDYQGRLARSTVIYINRNIED
jgi:hypothetical protein